MSRRISARIVLTGALVVLTLTGLDAGGAWAQSRAKVCIPRASSRPLLTPNRAGKCPSIRRVRYALAGLGGAGSRGPPGKSGPGGKRGPEGKSGLERKNTLNQAENRTLQ